MIWHSLGHKPVRREKIVKLFWISIIAFYLLIIIEIVMIFFLPAIQISINSLYAEALYIYSSNLVHQDNPNYKELNQALKYVKKASQLKNEKDPKILYTLAIAYFRIDQREKAEQIAERIKKCSSQNIELFYAYTLNDFAWILAVSDNYNDQDLNKALEWAKKASSLTSEMSPHILDTLAFIYFRRNQLDLALKYSRKAIALNPNPLDKRFKRTLKKIEDAKKSNNRQ